VVETATTHLAEGKIVNPEPAQNNSETLQPSSIKNTSCEALHDKCTK